MEIERLWFMAVMVIGVGLFGGFVFPCLNGPFNVLKFFRERIGKPFACPVCSFLWSVVIFSIGFVWIPTMVYMILGSVGWGILLMHVSSYQVFYQGMEDE